MWDIGQRATDFQIAIDDLTQAEIPIDKYVFWVKSWNFKIWDISCATSQNVDNDSIKILQLVSNQSDHSTMISTTFSKWDFSMGLKLPQKS